MSHDLFVALNTQDEKPLVAVPDEDEHLERRAAEVSKLLQDDSNDKDILKASLPCLFLEFPGSIHLSQTKFSSAFGAGSESSSTGTEKKARKVRHVKRMMKAMMMTEGSRMARVMRIREGMVGAGVVLEQGDVGEGVEDAKQRNQNRLKNQQVRR